MLLSKKHLFSLAVLGLVVTGCYFVSYFQGAKTAKSLSQTLGVVLGIEIGRQAGGINLGALGSVHAFPAALPPAPVRPDPDLYARRLLLQYRPEGTTVARQVGHLQSFSQLQGGAPPNFSTAPQTTYDSTSLLANMTVAEHICQGLVAPNTKQHGDWKTILPKPPSDWTSNIKFLVQRFTGTHSSTISDATMTSLKAVLDAYTSSGNYTLSSYVPVCTTLSIDAHALLH